MEPSNSNPYSPSHQRPPETGAEPRFAPSAPNKRRREGWKSILSTLAILILAPLIALTLTAFVFQSYEVDGPSMETTLQHNDRLIVNKIPRTFARITGHAYIPKRGDIIIFNKEDLEHYGGSVREKQLIKRVIGLPGDRVVIADGNLTIYNKEHPDGFQPDAMFDYGQNIPITSGNIDITVGKDEVFVSGDNRGNSLDSRSFGAIPASSIVGKLSFRIFPLNKLQHY